MIGKCCKNEALHKCKPALECSEKRKTNKHSSQKGLKMTTLSKHHKSVSTSEPEKILKGCCLIDFPVLVFFFETK